VVTRPATLTDFQEEFLAASQTLLAARGAKNAPPAAPG
jgi:hypothetical protein